MRPHKPACLGPALVLLHKGVYQRYITAPGAGLQLQPTVRQWGYGLPDTGMAAAEKTYTGG